MASGASASSSGTLSCQYAGGGTPSFAKSGDYSLNPGDVVNCTITGAKSLPNGSVNIYVKHGGTPTSSNYSMSDNNEVVPGTDNGGTITFTYDTTGLSTCETAALSYSTTMGAMKNSKGASSTFSYDGFSCDSSSPPPPATPPTAALKASDPASLSLTRTYAWTVHKSVDNASQSVASGTDATFNYTVAASYDAQDGSYHVDGHILAQNSNGGTVTGVTASVDDSNCMVADPATQEIPANSSSTFNYSCDWTSNPPAQLGLTVTWGSQTVDGAQLEGGTATASQPLDWDSASVTPENANVPVSDSIDSADAVQLGTTDPSGSNSWTESDAFTAPTGTCATHDNVASADGTTASASVQICGGSDLAVSSAVTGTSYTRTYGWSLTKKVNGSSLIEKIGGGTGSFSYTVGASHDNGTDSVWTVTGTITVTNPNDWESITANVSDTIDNGGTCTVDGGSSVTIAASSSETFNYSCAMGSAAGGTDTASASWDSGSAATADVSVSDSEPYSFGGPTTIVNGSTNVNDSIQGSLGSASYTDASPKNFTYTHAFVIPTSNCHTYPNTATLSVNGATASASVEVCGPAATGALSMGFWSNKNGQAIITGQGSTNCASGAWLRANFAPFQDLAAGASCSAVNTYVQGIIKSASASGASMNGMLKAQMLAVALDVYFSDGSLGGNKIGAPAPIGAVTIDLTHVGSSAENTSAAFGANSMSIAQLLSYAAGKSNPGGTTWYAQVKGTQGLAKDTFDAICNSLVYAP
jgi:YD repeat-containing protein